MPKQDKPRTIDLHLRSGPSTGGSWAPSTTGGSTPFDDTHLVARDGTRSLYASARWVWEKGAEVAGTLRSWGSGMLQVFGMIYAGRREGARASLGEYGSSGRLSAVLEAVGSDNVPVFSAGAIDTIDPDDAWCNIGREGYPRIYFANVVGYDRKIPVIDPRLIDGQISATQINITELTGNLTIPIVDSLAGLSYSEGQLFMLRVGVDSGALYEWTRWGPELVGGGGLAGIHTHLSDITGGVLTDYLQIADFFSGSANYLVPMRDTSESTGIYWGEVGSVLSIAEQDGSPEIVAVERIKFPNGSVTDEGDGIVSVEFSTVTPAASVVAETSFGATYLVGTASEYARADHTHGTPDNPVTAHEVTYDHTKLDLIVSRSAYNWFHGGTLSVGVLPAATLVSADQVTIERVTIYVTASPVGSAIIADIMADGTSIFSSDSNRPQIASGSISGYTTTIETATLTQYQKLTAQILQVGSGTAGDNLSIIVSYKQSSVAS